MIRYILAESAHLRYVLYAQINGVSDPLPPDRPFLDRISLCI